MEELYEIYLKKACSTSDINEAIENMQLALMYAKANVPKHVFDFQKINGTMWSEKNARAYLMIKGQLGYLYKVAGNYDDAITTYEDILKLDTDDNQDIKDKLIPLLVLKEKNEQAYRYIKKYEDDESTPMLYNKALYYFVNQDKFNAKLFMRRAIDKNKYVCEYFIGIKALNMPIKNQFEPGSEDEAKYYCNDAMMAWIEDKKRILWVVDEYFGYCEKHDVKLDWSREFVKAVVEKALFGKDEL